jgi:hypothetical protein
VPQIQPPHPEALAIAGQIQHRKHQRTAGQHRTDNLVIAKPAQQAHRGLQAMTFRRRFDARTLALSVFQSLRRFAPNDDELEVRHGGAQAR